MADAINPWLPANWSITAQGAFVVQYGLAQAELAASDAQSYIGATKPTPQGNVQIIQRQWILHKRVGGTGGLSGGSGSGAP